MPERLYVIMSPQDGKTCLAVAAEYGEIEVVKYLCCLGNNNLLQLPDNNGQSVLEIAKTSTRYRGKKSEVVEYLESLGIYQTE